MELIREFSEYSSRGVFQETSITLKIFLTTQVLDTTIFEVVATLFNSQKSILVLKPSFKVNSVYHNNKNFKNNFINVLVDKSSHCLLERKVLIN